MGNYHSEYGRELEDWYNAWAKNDSFVIKNAEFSYLYQTNEYGYREKSIYEIDTNERKIFFLGDSFTEGFGAATDSTFPKQVEKLFHRDSIDISVYNFGRSGSDPFQSFTTLRDQVIPLKPECVIICTHNNDLSDIMMRGGFERFQEDGTTKYKKGPWFHFFYKHSHIARFLVHQVYDYDWRLIKLDEFKERELQAKILLDGSFQRSDSLCRQYGIKFIALGFVDPWDYCYNNIKTNYSLNDLVDSNTTNYQVLHISEAMIKSKTAGECTDISWPQDRHYNALGYEILGECIYEKILPLVK